MAARAGGTVFHRGIRLLGSEQRDALGAIRGFGERIEGFRWLDPAERSRRLEQQALAVGGLSSPGSSDALIAALAVAHERFGLPLDALVDLIEDSREDSLGRSYESFDELLAHCRRTGGSIARLSVAVLSSGDRVTAAELAESLGVAVRLACIVRDLRSDAERGRVYLPVEDFGRYHLLGELRPSMTPAALAALAREGSVAKASALEGLDGGDQAQLYALMRLQVLRAGDWFHRAARLPTLLDRRGGGCVRSVSGYYGRLLERIERRPDRALRGQLALPIHEHAWVATLGLLGRDGRERHPAERLPLD